MQAPELWVLPLSVLPAWRRVSPLLPFLRFDTKGRWDSLVENRCIGKCILSASTGFGFLFVLRVLALFPLELVSSKRLVLRLGMATTSDQVQSEQTWITCKFLQNLPCCNQVCTPVQK